MRRIRWLLLTHDRARAVGRERTHRKRCEAAKHQLAGQCTVEVTSMVLRTLYLVQLYAGSRAWATADTRQTEMKRKTVMCRFD